MKQQKRCWVVWTGSSYEETWAVSEKAAMSNVAYRLRQRGKFPLLSCFTAELKDSGNG